MLGPQILVASRLPHRLLFLHASSSNKGFHRFLAPPTMMMATTNASSISSADGRQQNQHHRRPYSSHHQSAPDILFCRLKQQQQTQQQFNRRYTTTAATTDVAAPPSSTATTKTTAKRRWWLENNSNNSYYGLRPSRFNPNIPGVKLYSREEIASLLDQASRCVQQNKSAQAIATMDSLLCGLPPPPPPMPSDEQQQKQSSSPNGINGNDGGNADDDDNLAMTAATAAESLGRCADMALQLGEQSVVGTQGYLNAEGYLSVALRMAPGNKELLRKRNDILPEVDASDDHMLRTIDFLQEECKKTPLVDETLTEQKRKAYRELLVYNTLAIEGSPLSLDQVAHLMRSGAAGNEQEPAVEEALGMLNALHFADEQHKMGQQQQLENVKLLEFIRELHRLLLLDKPEFCGRFRSLPDHRVGIIGSPCVPVEGNFVEEEMHKFANFLNHALRDSDDDHPLEFAAFVHFAFVHVHPFFDGNGRLARLLMNMLLERHGFPPLIVPVSKRREYFSAIHFGEMGDLRRFHRFISYLMADTLRVMMISSKNKKK